MILLFNMTQQPELLAGIAEIDITPPVGGRMAGHFYEVVSTGIHDPLKAKAIVLQQGGVKLAFAFCDVVSLSPRVTEQVRGEFSESSGTAVADTVVLAIHNHTGPLFDDPRYDYFHSQAIAEHGRDPHGQENYSVFLADRLGAVLNQAHRGLAPANLAISSVMQEGLSFNRRYLMRDGSVRFNPGQLNADIVRPAGPIDPEFICLMVGDAGRARLLGSLSVFGCHPDTLGGTKYGADYPYYLQEILRKELGKDFISAFAAGTCGDVNHINVLTNDPRGGEIVSERIGRTLGEALITGGQLAAITSPHLGSRSQTLDIPLQATPSAQAVVEARATLHLLHTRDKDFMKIVEAIKILDLAERGPVWPAEIQAFRLDADTAIVSLPGEIFAELGLDIKAGSPFGRTAVMTLANDRLSYVPTARAFQEGSYEVTNSRVTPGAGEAMAEAAVGLLQELHEEM